MPPQSALLTCLVMVCLAHISQAASATFEAGRHPELEHRSPTDPGAACELRAADPAVACLPDTAAEAHPCSDGEEAYLNAVPRRTIGLFFICTLHLLWYPHAAAPSHHQQTSSTDTSQGTTSRVHPAPAPTAPGEAALNPRPAARLLTSLQGAHPPMHACTRGISMPRHPLPLPTPSTGPLRALPLPPTRPLPPPHSWWLRSPSSACQGHLQALRLLLHLPLLCLHHLLLEALPLFGRRRRRCPQALEPSPRSCNLTWEARLACCLVAG